MSLGVDFISMEERERREREERERGGSLKGEIITNILD